MTDNIDRMSQAGSPASASDAETPAAIAVFEIWMAPILWRMSANVYKALESSMGCRNFGQPIPTNVPNLFSKMLVEEGSDLLEGFLGLGRGIVADVMGVRHALIDLKGGFNAGLA
jgi:hypothetical protein